MTDEHDKEIEHALGNSVPNPEYLYVAAGDINLALLPMGELPARKVMGFLASKEGRLENALELMKLASKDPEAFEQDAEFISFNELLAVIDSWMELSSGHSVDKRAALEGDSKTKSRVSHKSASDFGFGVSRDKKRAGEMKMEIKLGDGEEVDEEIAAELANAISIAITEASHIHHNVRGQLEDLTEQQIILAVAMWFVKEGREAELVDRNLLTSKSRNGKYYPIIDGKVSRRFGFTEDEAKEWKKWQ